VYSAINEANDVKTKIENELLSLNSELFASSEPKKAGSHSSDLDYDDDTLMINEANEEIADKNNNVLNRASRLEAIMNEKLLIESLDSKID
jgi:hypothetical protein